MGSRDDSVGIQQRASTVRGAAHNNADDERKLSSGGRRATDDLHGDIILRLRLSGRGSSHERGEHQEEVLELHVEGLSRRV